MGQFQLSNGEKDDGKTSIFEELQGKYSKELAISHPIWTTYHCRRLVLQRAVDAMLELLRKTYRLTIESSTGKEIGKFSMGSYDNGAWVSDWRGPKFTKIWELEEDIEVVRLRLGRTIKLLQRIHQSRKAILVEKEKNELFLAQEERDLSEWNYLETQGKYMSQMIQRSRDSYLQTVSAADALTANSQARRQADFFVQ
jgi:hypothetical protein